MKKKILLFTAIAGMASLMLISGKNGAGAEKHYNCTGSETGLGNGTGCGLATGCHSTTATAGITVVLELDSAGIATTHYKGGMVYNVKITGTNTTATALPKFGFQVSCITGTVSVTTPTNAGTFATTGLPTDVRYTAAMLPSDFVCNVIEHSDPITATTGSGGTGTTYVESFQWTAPVSGTGAISFWGALNAVANDTTAPPDAIDSWNTTHAAINEWTSSTSVATVSNNISITAYPNPATSYLNIKMDNAQAGTYSLCVFDITGRMVTGENVIVNGTSQITSINTGNWAFGLYQLMLQKDGFSKTLQVIKK